MGPQEDYIETVVTCEGDFHDPGLRDRLRCFQEQLEHLLEKDGKSRMVLKKVEPWNSLKLTLILSKEAALRLKQLAEQKHPALHRIGVLGVQVGEDNNAALTFDTGKAGQSGNLESSASVSGTNRIPRLPGSSDLNSPNVTVDVASKNIANYLKKELGFDIPVPSGLSASETKELSTPLNESPLQPNNTNSKEVHATQVLPSFTSTPSFSLSLQGYPAVDFVPTSVSGAIQTHAQLSKIDVAHHQSAHQSSVHRPSWQQSVQNHPPQHPFQYPHQQQHLIEQTSQQQRFAQLNHESHDLVEHPSPHEHQHLNSHHNPLKSPHQVTSQYPPAHSIQHGPSQTSLNAHQLTTSQGTALPQTADVGDSLRSLPPPPPYPQKKGAGKAKNVNRKGKKTTASSPLLTNLLQTNVPGNKLKNEKPKKKKLRQHQNDKEAIASSSNDDVMHVSMDNGQSSSLVAMQAQTSTSFSCLPPVPLASRLNPYFNSVSSSCDNQANSDSLQDERSSTATAALVSLAQNQKASDEIETLINPRTGLMEPRNLVSDLSPGREQDSLPIRSAPLIDSNDTITSTPNCLVALSAETEVVSLEKHHGAARSGVTVSHQLKADGIEHHSQEDSVPPVARDPPLPLIPSAVTSLPSRKHVGVPAHTYTVNTSQLPSATLSIKPQQTYLVKSTTSSVASPSSRHYPVSLQTLAAAPDTGSLHVPAGQDGQVRLSPRSEPVSLHPVPVTDSTSTVKPGTKTAPQRYIHHTSSGSVQSQPDSPKMFTPVCSVGTSAVAQHLSNMVFNSPSGSRLLSDGDDNSNQSPVSQTDGITGPTSLMDANGKVDQHDSGMGSLSERSDDTTPSEVGDGDFHLSLLVNETACSSGKSGGDVKKMAGDYYEASSKALPVMTVGCVQSSQAVHPNTKRHSAADAPLLTSDKDSVQHTELRIGSSTRVNSPASQVTLAGQEFNCSMPLSPTVAIDQLKMKNATAISASHQIRGARLNSPVSAVEGARLPRPNFPPRMRVSVHQPALLSASDTKGSVRLHHLPTTPSVYHSLSSAQYQTLVHPSPSHGNIRGFTPTLVSHSQQLHYSPTSVTDGQELRYHLLSVADSKSVQNPPTTVVHGKLLLPVTSVVTENHRLNHPLGSVPMSDTAHPVFPNNLVKPAPQLAVSASVGTPARPVAATNQELPPTPPSIPGSQRLHHAPVPVPNHQSVRHPSPSSSSTQGSPRSSPQEPSKVGLQHPSSGLHYSASVHDGQRMPFLSSAMNQLGVQVPSSLAIQKLVQSSSPVGNGRDIQSPSAVMRQLQMQTPPSVVNQQGLQGLRFVSQQRFQTPTGLNQQRLQRMLAPSTVNQQAQFVASQQRLQAPSVVNHPMSSSLNQQSVQLPSAGVNQQLLQLQSTVASQQGSQPPSTAMNMQTINSASSVNQDGVRPKSAEVIHQGIHLSTVVNQKGLQQLNHQTVASASIGMNHPGVQQHAPNNQMLQHSLYSSVSNQGLLQRPRSVPNNYGVHAPSFAGNRVGSPQLPNRHRLQSPVRTLTNGFGDTGIQQLPQSLPSSLGQSGLPSGPNSRQASPQASEELRRGSPSLTAQPAVLFGQGSNVFFLNKIGSLTNDGVSSIRPVGPRPESVSSTPPSPSSSNIARRIQLKRPLSDESGMADGKRFLIVTGQEMKISEMPHHLANLNRTDSPTSTGSPGPRSSGFQSPSPAPLLPGLPLANFSTDISLQKQETFPKLLAGFVEKEGQGNGQLGTLTCESPKSSGQQQGGSHGAVMTQPLSTDRTRMPAKQEQMYSAATSDKAGDLATNRQAKQASSTSSTSDQPTHTSNHGAAALPSDMNMLLESACSGAGKPFDHEEHWSLLMEMDFGKELKKENTSDCDNGSVRAEAGGVSNITSMYSKPSSPVNVNMLNHMYAAGLPQPRRLTESVQRLVKPLPTTENSLVHGGILKPAGMASSYHPNGSTLVGSSQGGARPGASVPMLPRTACTDTSPASMVHAATSSGGVRYSLSDVSKALNQAQDMGGALPNGAYHHVSRTATPTGQQVGLPTLAASGSHNLLTGGAGTGAQVSSGVPRLVSPLSVTLPSAQRAMVPTTHSRVLLPSDSGDFNGSQGFKDPQENPALHVGNLNAAPTPAVCSMAFQLPAGTSGLLGESMVTGGKRRTVKRKNDGESSQGKKKRTKQQR